MVASEKVQDFRKFYVRRAYETKGERMEQECVGYAYGNVGSLTQFEQAGNKLRKKFET